MLQQRRDSGKQIETAAGGQRRLNMLRSCKQHEIGMLQQRRDNRKQIESV